MNTLYYGDNLNVLEGDNVSEMLQAFRSFIGENEMMAYLVMMTVGFRF